MTGLVRLLPALVALSSVAGCNFANRRWLDNPGRNETVRVESGQRLYLDLEENVTAGYRWEARCDDADVSVTVEHVAARPADGRVGAPGRARVEIRVHRGYDGPSAVRFRYRRPWEPAAAKEFTVCLYRRTGDCAFWE